MIVVDVHQALNTIFETGPPCHDPPIFLLDFRGQVFVADRLDHLFRQAFLIPHRYEKTILAVDDPFPVGRYIRDHGKGPRSHGLEQ